MVFREAKEKKIYMYIYIYISIYRKIYTRGLKYDQHV